MNVGEIANNNNNNSTTNYDATRIVMVGQENFNFSLFYTCFMLHFSLRVPFPFNPTFRSI